MTAAANAYKIGVDIGGTFTDVTIVETGGRVTSHKTPSTPRAPAEAVLRGLHEAIDRARLDPARCMSFVHGSTIGVNTIIQRTGARVGVLLTKGFEDLLELGRTKMPDPFSLFTMRPVPLARKDMVRGVVERIDAKGRVITRLDEQSLVAGAKELLQAGADILAVVFINAYRNPAHEQQARSRLREAFPKTELIASTDIWPQVREYERATVAVMNGYIAPKMEQYLGELQKGEGGIGLRCPLYITSSNGGIVPISHAIARPISTLLSGPASGVVATLQLMKASKLDQVVTMDIGGTSADLCVLDGGNVPYAWDQEIDGLPVTLPSVDVSSIGAGGGSIAYADNMGLLRVGPQSAGADPGPVAYGRGGTQPTLTDAYLVSGFIDPANFLGGQLPLDIERARGAIDTLAKKLKLGFREAASGVIEVATSNLAAEFTRLAAKKGIDPREYTLVPFGGAGATHACLLAEDVHIRRIAIPYSPGTFCATGSVLADFRLDYVRTVYSPVDKMDQADVDAWVKEMEARARDTLAEGSDQIESTYTVRTADVRYAGQGYEVAVQYDRLAELPERFRNEYIRLYGPRIDEAPLEVISIRATVIGVSRKATPGWGGGEGRSEPRGSRRIEFSGHEYECLVYARAEMAPGWTGVGPFIVDQPDTTCVVTPGWRGRVDAIGTLHLTRES
jgi:N-methylhydantoinase A